MSLFTFDTDDAGALETLKVPFGLKALCELSADKVVVDVGANIGWYTVGLALTAKSVVAFEPIPQSFELLRKNAASLDNVKVYQQAIGPDGEREMFFNEKMWGCAGFGSIMGSRPSITVNVRTLDSFRLEPGVLKVDVEGFELDVLRSAEQTLRLHHPVVFCEMIPWGPHFGRTPEMIVQFMQSLGYGYKFVMAGGNGWFSVKPLPNIS